MLMKVLDKLKVAALVVSVTAGGGFLFRAFSQTTSAPPPAAARPVPPRPSAYPQRPAADPALVEQGKGSYSVRCAFCHGSDARGGESGPNLLRSSVVLSDKNGELIRPVVQHGRPELGMPAFDLSDAQVDQIVAFLHSIPVSGNERGGDAPKEIPLGDAAAGKLGFNAVCATCHSVSGDLKGIGTKIPDAKMLQQTWLMPGTRGSSPEFKASPKTAAITLSDGQKLEGLLAKIDDFRVSIVLPDGDTRTITRSGDEPHVVVNNPLIAHQNLLPTYTDKFIHDLTAYLATVK